MHCHDLTSFVPNAPLAQMALLLDGQVSISRTVQEKGVSLPADLLHRSLPLLSRVFVEACRTLRHPCVGPATISTRASMIGSIPASSAISAIGWGEGGCC